MSRLIRVRVGRRPDLPVDPPPASWQTAWDSNDHDTIVAWYESNTGFDAYYHEGLERYVQESDLTLHTSNVSTTHDGQIIELLDVKGRINIDHKDVTIRACRMEVNGNNRGCIHLNGNDGQVDMRTHVEYVTFLKPSRTSDSDDRNVFVRHGSQAGFYIGYCKVPYENKSDNMRFLGARGTAAKPIVIEYNFVRSGEPKSTAGGRLAGIGIRSQGTSGIDEIAHYKVRRNCVWGGGSAVITCWARDGQPWHDVDLVENLIVNLDRDNRDVVPRWYQTVDGGTFYSLRFDPGATYYNVKSLGNKWSRYSYPASGRNRVALNFPSGSSGSEWDANNVMLPPNGPTHPGITVVPSDGTVNYGAREDWSFAEPGGWTYTP